MKTILLTVCLSITLLASCISPKKYKMLEADYQKAGAAQRSYEQEHKILLVEIQDMKQRMTRLEAENHLLDSTNHALRQRIINENVESAWKEKYEALEKATQALAPEGKMRGDVEEPTQTNKNGRIPPPITSRDKGYTKLKKLDEKELVKRTEQPTKEVSEPKTPIVEKVPEQPKKEIVSKETITATGQTKDLHKQIEKVLEPYKLGENVTQTQQEEQIILALSDDVLFETENSDKLSVMGEELLHKLVYTFGQYPRITIDLVSEGTQSEEKTKKISEIFSQYNIKIRILPKNNIPLAFETSGTQKSNNLLTVRMD